MRISITYLLFGIWIFAGCASPYKNQKGISFFGGYRDEEVSPGIYKVTFNGNGYTSLDRVRLCVMYRCAELTLERGYDYYAELDEPQIRSTLPTLFISPGGTMGTPSAHTQVAIIQMLKGTKPVDIPQAKNAKEVKAEIETVLFPGKKN